MHLVTLFTHANWTLHIIICSQWTFIFTSGVWGYNSFINGHSISRLSSTSAVFQGTFLSSSGSSWSIFPQCPFSTTTKQSLGFLRSVYAYYHDWYSKIPRLLKMMAITIISIKFFVVESIVTGNVVINSRRYQFLPHVLHRLRDDLANFFLLFVGKDEKYVK